MNGHCRSRGAPAASFAWTRTALFALAGAALAVLGGPPPATAATADATGAETRFTPHRAIYRMDLRHADEGADVSAASGAMYYRFRPTCEAWEVETQVFLRLGFGTRDAAEVVETTWTFASLERFDGTKFSFDMDHKRNGAPLEAFSGRVSGGDGDGEAVIDVVGHDRPIHLDVPDETLYPARHLGRLLEKARNGQRRYHATVFDGASLYNPYRVNAFVVGRTTDPAPALASRAEPALVSLAGTDLAASPVWRVRLAYFPLDDAGELPEFELEIDFREDGIARHMVQDFGDFSLDLTPERLEVLPFPDCR